MDIPDTRTVMKCYRRDEGNLEYHRQKRSAPQGHWQKVNKGVELNVFGEPIEGLRLMAGGTRMTSELKKTAGGLTDGNHAIGLPTFQLNASVDWDVPGLEGAALSARMLRTGGQYADQATNLSLPTWNRFDAGARYKLKVDQMDLTLRVNVENITDKNYWASANGGYLSQGDPRWSKSRAPSISKSNGLRQVPF
ncbi:TonB-dependent siderophore receptor [Pseudomonas savastanoi pv. glycinea]|nr:TonB-dependent siderophore receptor [Pseudomonas savastanoi pv. glycinea]